MINILLKAYRLSFFRGGLVKPENPKKKIHIVCNTLFTVDNVYGVETETAMFLGQNNCEDNHY